MIPTNLSVAPSHHPFPRKFSRAILLKRAAATGIAAVLGEGVLTAAPWLDTGRFYERLALTLTAAGIQTAFLNQPVEVGTLRSQLRDYLGLGTLQPQLLMRFGYAPRMPRSLRRPIDAVIL